jgi:hypothetical protein
LNKREIDAFPLDLDLLEKSNFSQGVSDTVASLMADIDKNSERSIMRFKHDVLTIQFIFAGRSKEYIDELDRLIGDYYGLSVFEIDHIVNYDAKYRAGSNGKDAQ